MLSTIQVAKLAGVDKKTVLADIERELITPIPRSTRGHRFTKEEAGAYALFRRTMPGRCYGRAAAFDIERRRILSDLRSMGLDQVCEREGLSKDSLKRNLRNWKYMRDPITRELLYPDVPSLLRNL